MNYVSFCAAFVLLVNVCGPKNNNLIDTVVFPEINLVKTFVPHLQYIYIHLLTFLIPQIITEQFLQCCKVHYPAESGHCCCGVQGC